MPTTAQKMVWSEALQKGELVYAMTQYQTLQCHIPPGSNLEHVSHHTGYSFGLSLEWLVKRQTGQDFRYDTLSQVYSDINWSAVVLHQDLVRAGFHRDSKPLSDSLDRAIYKLMGRNVRNPKRTQENVPLCMIKYELDICGRFVLMIFRGEMSTHAVAVEKTARDCRFFDPNYGHFCFDNFDRLQQWLTKFFMPWAQYEAIFKMVTLCTIVTMV